jgi:hypothetical protein
MDTITPTGMSSTFLLLLLLLMEEEEAAARGNAEANEDAADEEGEGMAASSTVGDAVGVRIMGDVI